MDVSRRNLLAASTAGVAGAIAASPEAARAAQSISTPISTFGRDATQYGVHPGSPDDQTGALQRAIDDLPAGYRLMFVLHDIEGYEHNEIATMLECSIGTSKSQLHKARLKLRDALRIETKREVPE